MHAIRPSSAPCALPTKNSARAGTPGGTHVANCLATAAVAECLSGLAGSLFSVRDRNHRIMCHWLNQPVRHTGADAAPPAAAASAPQPSWEEEERRRQLSRRKKVTNLALASSSPVGPALPAAAASAAAGRKRSRGGSSSTDTLLAKSGAARAAATAAIGRRAVRQHTSSPAFVETVARLHRSDAAPHAGPVAWLCDLLLAILTEPVRFTIVTDGGRGLLVYPFGARGRCAHMLVPETVLTVEELGWLQFLALTAAAWTDVSASAQAGAAAAGQGASGLPPEHLLAGPEANDAFELALDRMAVATGLCEQVARFSEHSPVIRQILEAAVMAAAAADAAVQAGFHGALTGLAFAIRQDQPRTSRMTDQQWHELAVAQAAYAVQHGVTFYYPDAYNALLVAEANAPPPPPRRLTAASASAAAARQP